MTEEIKEYLKNNLKLEYEVSGGVHGSHTFKELKLTLEGVEISYVYIED